MAWTTFPLSAGDPFQTSFLELSTAYGERVQALGFTAPTVGGNPGDDIQKAAGSTYESYLDWQTWMEANCGSFVRTDQNYDGGGVPYNPAHGSNPVDWLYDLTTFRAAASLNASGFTRRYWRTYAGPSATVYDDGSAFANGHKALDTTTGLVYTRAAGAWTAPAGCWGVSQPDAVTTYGLMQAGDFIDHLTLNELYQAFHALRWRFLAFSLADVTINEGDNNPGRGGAPSYTWATAKTDAEASWDTGTPAPSVGVREFTAPTAYSLGYYAYVGVVPQPKAELQGQRMRLDTDLSGVWAGVSRSVEFYAHAEPPPLHETAGAGDLTFDANGFTLSADDWRKFDAAGPTASVGVLSSSYLGLAAATAYPTWCDEPLPVPTSPALGPTTERGFFVRSLAVLVKWDQAGGFTKP